MIWSSLGLRPDSCRSVRRSPRRTEKGPNRPRRASTALSNSSCFWMAATSGSRDSCSFSLSSYPFYGYLKSTNEKYHLEIEPGAAGVIKKIFHWYAAGSSTKEIAQKLNRTNTMTPLLWLVKFCGFKLRFEKGSTKGTRWTSSSVMHILKDERYTGKCIYGKTKVAKIGSWKLIKQPESEWFVVPNRFPVIITQALFDKTAAIRKSRARTKVKKGEPSPRIFLGNIRCGHCGYAMNFHETKYPYYICHARQADNDLHCQGTRIMESDLAEVVLNALKQFAQVCIDSERRLEKRREVMRSERAQISCPFRAILHATSFGRGHDSKSLSNYRIVPFVPILYPKFSGRVQGPLNPRRRCAAANGCH